VNLSPKSRRIVAVATALSALSFGVAACGSSNDSKSSSTKSSSSSSAKADKVGVLLPDTKSSVRWESFDRPLLQDAFKKAGVPVTIENAQGDKSTQQQQAEQLITNGAKTLLLVNLDSGSGAAIEANAKSRGVKVIDYDRLTLKGSADYYVSFDNVQVGKLQGQGLVGCLKKSGAAKPAIAELNGSPTDNNATLFKQGYDSVLKPLYSAGKATKVADQSVPDWDNQKALTIFEQMLQKSSNKIDGVLAANDGLGNSVISALKARKLKQIPVTGQDATPQGIQHILLGDQCMTVYKAVKKEADAASQLAIALSKKQAAPAGLVNGQSDDSARKVPSVLLTPQLITKANVKVPFDDGFLKPSEVCVGQYAAACKSAGIT
jgi:D-xylose transport system substrate-binding protein